MHGKYSSICTYVLKIVGNCDFWIVRHCVENSFRHEDGLHLIWPYHSILTDWRPLDLYRDIFHGNEVC